VKLDESACACSLARVPWHARGLSPPYPCSNELHAIFLSQNKAPSGCPTPYDHLTLRPTMPTTSRFTQSAEAERIMVSSPRGGKRLWPFLVIFLAMAVPQGGFKIKPYTAILLLRPEDVHVITPARYLTVVRKQ
jgi:hypothetical protein